MALTEKDKKVIYAFTYREPLESRILRSVGNRLDYAGLGGHGVAEWKGGKIHLRPLGGRYEAQIHRYIRKIVPANWLASGSRQSAPNARRDRNPNTGISRVSKREIGPTGATAWHLPNRQFLYWNGPGGRLYLGSPNRLIPIEHPTADKEYQTRAAAEAAAKRFLGP